MIRFLCKNCGQKIKTYEKFAGKRAKCPKCKHSLVVPRLKKVRKPTTTKLLSIKSNPNQSSHTLASKIDTQTTKDPMGLKICEETTDKKQGSFLKPHYTETTLFIMSTMLISLFVVSKTMRKDLNASISWWLDDRDFRSYISLIVLAVFLLFGFYKSIYHAFSIKQKQYVEKASMLFFAVLVSTGTGLYAGYYMIRNTKGWLLLFPVWNVIYSGLLLIKFWLMFRGLKYGRKLDVSYISDRNATLAEVILASASGIIILTICQFVFKLHWAITFSICISYMTSFEKAVRSVFLD